MSKIGSEPFALVVVVAVVVVGSRGLANAFVFAGLDVIQTRQNEYKCIRTRRDEYECIRIRHIKRIRMHS